jgi:PhnB protein
MAMRLNPHLMFNGQCEAAFRFYERCFGGKLMLLTYGDSPDAHRVPPEWRGKIVHTTLTIGDDVLQGADVLPEHYEKPQGFSVMLSIENLADAERIYHALGENGTVRMPMQKTFWSPGFAALIDQFGTPWEISTRL